MATGGHRDYDPGRYERRRSTTRRDHDWHRNRDSWEPNRQPYDNRARYQDDAVTSTRDESDYEEMSLNRTSARSGEPGSTSNASHHSPLTGSRREAEAKHLVELLCDRVYWYTRRDLLDKKAKTIQDEFERCRQGYPETSNHCNVLKIRIDQMSKDATKCQDRLRNADHKLLENLCAFIDKHEKSTSTPSHGLRSEDLEARLEAFHKSLQEQLQTRPNEGTAEISSSIFTQLQKETAESRLVLDQERQRNDTLRRETADLRVGLQQEKQRNDELQKKMEELERRLCTLDQSQTSLTEDSFKINSARLQLDKTVIGVGNKLDELAGQVDDMVKKMVTTEALYMAFGQFDDFVSSSENSTAPEEGGLGNEAGTKTKTHLRCLTEELNRIKLSLQSDSMDEAPKCILDMQKQLVSCVSTVQGYSNHYESISETVRSVEKALRQISTAQGSHINACSPSGAAAAHSGGPTTAEIDKLFDEKTEVLRSTLQQQLMRVAHELGSFIDKERIARQAATTRAEQSSADVSALRHEVGQSKDGVAASVAKLDQEVSRQGNYMIACRNELSGMDARLQQIVREAEANLEKLSLQLQVVNAWQSNFTTKPLYEDIARHITSTLPSGVLHRVSALTARTEAIEAVLNVGRTGTPWKRKTPQE